MTEYRLQQIDSSHDVSKQLLEFIRKGAKEVSDKYGAKYKWENFRIWDYVYKNRFVTCWKNNKPVGFMMSRLTTSIFDPDFKILTQDLLYAEPGTKATYLLMNDFIDFGQSNANHIITMIGTQTNIKSRSLERLGFEKMEELYSMET